VASSAPIPSSLFLSHNTALVPPYRVLVDTNFINLSLENRLEIVRGMMDCLYAKCELGFSYYYLYMYQSDLFTCGLGIPCISDCVMAELEKLGPKYRLALRCALHPSDIDCKLIVGTASHEMLGSNVCRAPIRALTQTIVSSSELRTIGTFSTCATGLWEMLTFLFSPQDATLSQRVIVFCGDGYEKSLVFLQVSCRSCFNIFFFSLT
jgi:hypothetical protein